MLTDREISRLVARIVERYQPEQVVLFGSYAKGTATGRSDIDLLVVVDTSEHPSRRADRIMPLVGHMTVRVDLHVYTPEEVEVYSREEHHFLHSVLRSGRVVFRHRSRTPTHASTAKSTEGAPTLVKPSAG